MKTQVDVWILVTPLKSGDRDCHVLVDGLPIVHLPFQEGVTLLFDVVVYDPRKLLLPNLQPVYVDIVGDVLKFLTTLNRFKPERTS